jgi:penicillin-binding protein 1A
MERPEAQRGISMKRKIRSYHFSQKSEKKKTVLWKKYTLFLTAVFLVTMIISLILLAQSLPSLMELEEASDPVLISRILSKDGVVLDELFFKKRIYVPFDLIPENMKEAVLASEDRRFYQHWGLDLKRIGKAILVDLIHMEKKEGASTLSQQLARNLYLNKKKTWARKLREQLTSRFTGLFREKC